MINTYDIQAFRFAIGSVSDIKAFIFRWIATISMGQHIVLFKGSEVEFF